MGIEPMSTAWKAAMLPLHQRCLEFVIKFDEKSMQRTGLVLISTSFKTAMLSLQQQSMLKLCRHYEFFVLLRNLSSSSDKKF